MSEHPELRLKIHNSGKVRSTKHYRPFHLVFTEEVGNKEEVRIREKYLKSMTGRKYLDEKII